LFDPKFALDFTSNPKHEIIVGFVRIWKVLQGKLLGEKWKENDMC